MKDRIIIILIVIFSILFVCWTGFICYYMFGSESVFNFGSIKSNLEQNKTQEDIDAPISDDKNHYNSALKFLGEKNYRQAMEEIKKVENKEYENFEQNKLQIYYEYGKHLLRQGDYNGGISTLESVLDYKDSNILVNNAYIELAEKHIKDGKLTEAKTIYDYLSPDLEYNGIKVSNRKSQLNKYIDLIKITGKKYATKSYCESRNVWKYDGRWTNWHNDTPDSSEYINTNLTLNNDGTVTLKGTAYFYVFNSFSSLRDYCKANIISKTFEIKNITSVPASYKIDENTQLLYSNGIFSIKYNKKDDYSTNFYNLYISTVTY